MQLTTIALSDRYRRAIWIALLQQIPFAVICLLLLDYGRSARVFGTAMLGFWLSVVLIMARRPIAPSAGDLAFLRYGFWAVFALVVLLGRLIAAR